MQFTLAIIGAIAIIYWVLKNRVVSVDTTAVTKAIHDAAVKGKDVGQKTIDKISEALPEKKDEEKASTEKATS